MTTRSQIIQVASPDSAQLVWPVTTLKGRKESMQTSRWARSAALAAISLFALGAPLIVGVGASFATGTAPAWEPDANAAAPYGNLTFYDADGNEVTSGTNLASPFSYVVANTAADSGATKASVAFYNPQHGVVPASWTGTDEAGPTAFNPSLAGAPADITALAPTYPVTAASSADIGTWLSANTPDTTAGYANTIEVRLTDSGPGSHGNAAGTYWESDIGYNNTSSPITVDGTTVPADGWAELFPLVTATTTTLVTSATGGQLNSGSSITLTATVPSGDAGSVQFYDNGTFLDLASPTSGTATYSYTPAAGTHVYTASFIPTLGDETGAGTATASIVGGSTSAAVTVVDGTATTTGVTASATNVAFGTSVTFTATASAADSTNPAGTVEFLNGTTPISGCTAVAINPPTSATCPTSTLPSGADSITAVFTPTSSSYASSTSPAVVVTVTGIGTTTTLSASATSAAFGTSVTFTATASASDSSTQAGTVEFRVGTAAITGCTAVAINPPTSATCTTGTLPQATDSITAVFTPTSSSYGSSTSAAIMVTVGPPPQTATVATLWASNTSPTYGTSVTFTAAAFTSAGSTNPAGTVEFFNGTAPISGCTSVAINPPASATCTTSALPQGSDNMNVVFTPTSTSYAPSTSSAVVVTVTAPISTTTMLSASATSVDYDTPVTFTATASASDNTNPAGTVEFLDGTSAITGCTAIAINPPASANCTTSALPLDSDSITAVFTPTDSSYPSSTSSAVVVTVAASPVTVKSITPSSLKPGTSESVTVTGSGFLSGATLTGPTGVTFSKVKVVSSTKLTATVKVAANEKAGKDLAITVINGAASGEGRGTGKVLTIVAVAAPTVKSITPSSLKPGTSESVTVTGTDFLSGTTLTGPTGVTFKRVKVLSTTEIIAIVEVTSSAKAGKDLPVTVVAADGSRGTADVLTIT